MTALGIRVRMPSAAYRRVSSDNVELARAAARKLFKIRGTIAIEPSLRPCSRPAGRPSRGRQVPPARATVRCRHPEAAKHADSCGYVVEILGEIADERARNVLLEALSDERPRRSLRLMPWDVWAGW